MKIVGLIQARMGSVRLPEKVMRPLAGRPLVWHILDRLRRVPQISDVVLATTAAPENDPLAAWGQGEGLVVVRHPQEDDIAGRLAMAVVATQADLVVKINADCPLADPVVIDAALDLMRQDASADGVTNKLRTTYPLGYSVEVLRAGAIEWCDRNLVSPQDRELTVKWIFDRPDQFRILSLEGQEDDSKFNLTVDTPGDYKLMSEIFDALYSPGGCFGWCEVKEYLTTHHVPPNAYLEPAVVL